MAETKQADLRGRSLFIAIPAYDGKINIASAFQLPLLAMESRKYGFTVHHVLGLEAVLPNDDLADIHAYLQSIPKAADYKSIPLLNPK